MMLKKISNAVFTVRNLWVVIGTIAVYTALSAILAYSGIKLSKISGSSMEPTLYDGDITISIESGDYEAGDIVSFISPQGDGSRWIKRVIGVPGDVVEIYGDYLEVNGVPDEISLKYNKVGKKSTKRGSIVLLLGEYFLSGDNREVSLDSRYVGAINEELILSEMLFSY